MIFWNEILVIICPSKNRISLIFRLIKSEFNVKIMLK